MRPVKQRMFGGNFSPDGASSIGDCFKCCIASILEREYEAVPHFIQLEFQVGYYHLDLLNNWLRLQGYCFRAHLSNPHVALLSRNDVAWDSKGQRLTSTGVLHPGYWIADVNSKRYPDKTHAVVMFEDKMVFDPSDLFGTPEYDEKPYEFTGWVTSFIVPNPHEVPRVI